MSSTATNIKQQQALQVVLLSYEFTYSPFSGNGILARSLVKSLLRLGCQVTVWCCRPSETVASSHHSHLETPELSPEQSDRFNVFATSLSPESGWRRLDDQSAYSEFQWNSFHPPELERILPKAEVICAIDWTGSLAYRSIPPKYRQCRMVYLNFRVYSAGVSSTEKKEWFNAMEQQALETADVIVALSEHDKVALKALLETNTKDIHVLLPPLRGDMVELAKLPQDELESHLPPRVAERIGNRRCLVTSVVRLSPEKNVIRFVHFVSALQPLLAKHSLVPLLAGACADPDYATRVREELSRVCPTSIVLVDSFLSPSALAAIFSKTIFNFHPCSYDAYGMTIVEAAAFGVPSILASGDSVGASALIGDSSIRVDLLSSSVEGEGSLPPHSIAVLESVFQQEDMNDKLHRLGESAREKASAWDEAAYGKRLLGYLQGDALLEN